MVTTLPALFVSHGAPTLVREPGPTHEFLQGLGPTLGRPAAIVCISAHWTTPLPQLTSAAWPETVHDFYGFEPELYRIRYPAAGEPALARRVKELLLKAGIEATLDGERGLDHGAWVPLALMYPDADVPVVQLSVQPARDPRHHLAMGEALEPLRHEGVLILASGGATHNLAEFGWQAADAPPPDYVRAFETWLVAAVTKGDREALVDYRRAAPYGTRNHPTPEHYLPLLVALGAGGAQGRAKALHRSFGYGVLSLAAFAWE